MNAKLECTTDYDLFESHSYNRDLRDLSMIKSSMIEHGFRPSSAIHVVRNGNNKLKIKRGHHRFAAAKELGLPVWYIVDDDTMSIFEWEFDQRQSWNLYDFVKSYANAGNENYQKALDYANDNHMPIGTAMPIVGGHHAGSWDKSRIDNARAGRFIAVDTDHAKELSDLIQFIRQEGIPFATHRQFVAALSMAIVVPGFDKQIFKSRIKLHPKLMKKRSTRHEFLEEIENAYNYYASRNRLDIKNSAIEQARKSIKQKYAKA